ncbi:MAG: DinB family protein, partial [Rhodothermales bacterium]
MNNILFPLRSILQLNTKLWLNCLEHVSDNIAWKRPSPDTNSLGFIALHLVDARYYLAAYAGLDIQNPYKEALAHVRSIEDLREQERPTVEQLRRDWRAVSDVVEQGLAALKAEDLHADSPQPFP